jgi:hypothetical protein
MSIRKITICESNRNSQVIEGRDVASLTGNGDVSIYVKISWAGRKWLIIYGFASRSRNFPLIRRRHHCRWRLRNIDLCSALRVFEQAGIFIVPHLLWHGTSVFPVSSEGPPHLVASYDTRRDVEDLFKPRFSRGWVGRITVSNLINQVKYSWAGRKLNILERGVKTVNNQSIKYS